MYAQLGDIVFEGLFGPNAEESEEQTEYAEVKILNSYPDLQRVGLGLDEITLQIRLHFSFCDPDLSYKLFRTARLNGDVLPYVDGVGNLIGNFVILKIKQTMVHKDPRGGVLHSELEINLKQYVDPNRQLSKQLQAQREAFAISELVPPSTVIITPISSPAAEVMAPVRDVVSGSEIAADNIAEAAKDPEKGDSLYQAAKKGIGQVQDGINKLVSKAQQYQTQIASYQELVNQAGVVKQVAGDLSNSINNKDIAGINTNSALLTGASNSLLNVSLPIQRLLILR